MLYCAKREDGRWRRGWARCFNLEQGRDGFVKIGKEKKEERNCRCVYFREERTRERRDLNRKRKGRVNRGFAEHKGEKAGF